MYLTSKTGIKSVCKITKCTLDAPVKFLQLRKWLLPVDFTTGENTKNNNNNKIYNFILKFFLLLRIKIYEKIKLSFEYFF